jgi:hypothetical protein
MIPYNLPEQNFSQMTEHTRYFDVIFEDFPKAASQEKVQCAIENSMF